MPFSRLITMLSDVTAAKTTSKAGAQPAESEPCSARVLTSGSNHEEPHRRCSCSCSSNFGAAQELAVTRVTKLWCFHPPGHTTNSSCKPPHPLCRVTTSWRVPAASLGAVTTGRERGTQPNHPPAPQDGARGWWRVRIIKPFWGKATLLGPLNPSAGQIAQTGLDRPSPSPFCRAIKRAKFALVTGLKHLAWAPADVSAKPKRCKPALPQQPSHCPSLVCFITQQKGTHIFWKQNYAFLNIKRKSYSPFWATLITSLSYSSQGGHKLNFLVVTFSSRVESQSVDLLLAMFEEAAEALGKCQIFRRQRKDRNERTSFEPPTSGHLHSSHRFSL